MQDDLITSFTPSCHALVSFSIGYFIYDALDMALYHRYTIPYNTSAAAPSRRRS